MNEDNPMGWSQGAPKSDSEGWNLHRRDELLGTATTILLARMRHTESWNDGEAAEDEEVERAFRMARKMIARADREVPRA